MPRSAGGNASAEKGHRPARAHAGGAGESAVSGASDASLVPAATIDEAYAAAGAARWGVARATLAEALAGAARARFGDAAAGPGPAAVRLFVSTLHLPDLALACACADGCAEAWDHFVLAFRPELYRAARAIAGDAGSRELADSLYADLFGVPTAGGARRSLLRYYHGRSKLSTWLRSVLAQRHVDTLRAARRLTSLDDPAHATEERMLAAPAPEPERAPRMRAAAEAVSEAINTLEPPDRLRLAYYYVHELTLAQTGRLLGEHEATASRKLEHARKALRARIEAALGTRGLASTDIDDWAAVARESWDAALADALGVPAPRPEAASSGASGAGVAQGAARAPFKGKRTP